MRKWKVKWYHNDPSGSGERHYQYGHVFAENLEDAIKAAHEKEPLLNVERVAIIRQPKRGLL